jgi:DNA-binding PadR family transcriptional regulator
MTGAYAQEWPGRGAWGMKEGRGCGPEGGRGRHGGGYGPRGGGRGGLGGRGGRGFGGRGDFPIEALAGWLMSRGEGPGGPGRHGPGRHGPLDPEQLEKLEELIALRRMRGRGPGPFGRGGGRGSGPRGRGRARRGDVRLAVLRLLAEEPRNGYQLMQVIEERSGGQWKPSPGSMYPTLSQLEDEGLIRSVEAEGGRRFEITDAGRTDLESREGEPDPWAPKEDADESAMLELGPLVIAIGKATWEVASAGSEDQRARAAQLLAETRRNLYGILAEEPGQSSEPQDPADAADGDGDSAEA